MEIINSTNYLEIVDSVHKTSVPKTAIGNITIDLKSGMVYIEKLAPKSVIVSNPVIPINWENVTSPSVSSAEDLYNQLKAYL